MFGLSLLPPPHNHKLWKNYVNRCKIITGFIFLIKHKLYIYIIISLIPNNDLILILILTLFWNRQFLYFHILIPSFSVISFWEILKWNFPYNLYSNVPITGILLDVKSVLNIYQRILLNSTFLVVFWKTDHLQLDLI